MPTAVLTLGQLQSRLRGIAASEWPRLLQAILRLPEADRQPDAAVALPVASFLLLWDWLSRIGLTDTGQRRFLLTACQPTLNAWCAERRGRFRLVVVDEQYATWTNASQWVCLVSETSLPRLPVEPITTVAGDLTAMLARLGVTDAPDSIQP